MHIAVTAVQLIGIFWDTVYTIEQANFQTVTVTSDYTNKYVGQYNILCRSGHVKLPIICGLNEC